MGSLMAGWDSPVHDPKHVAYSRNRSFTKEEIEAYWRARKKAEEEVLQLRRSTSSSPSDGTHEREVEQEFERKYGRSNSLPLEFEEAETNWEKLMNSKAWWRRSNWAFLNEPPAYEGSTNSYVPQFHVANRVKSNLGAKSA